MTARGLELRLDFWRRRILPEWRVVLMDHPPDPPPLGDWVACVESTPTIFEARVYFKDELLERDRAQIDRVIVHELVHVPIDTLLEHELMLEQYVPPHVLEIFHEGRLQAHEQLVDRLAHAIADAHNGDPSYGTRRGRS